MVSAHLSSILTLILLYSNAVLCVFQNFLGNCFYPGLLDLLLAFKRSKQLFGCLQWPYWGGAGLASCIRVGASVTVAAKRVGSFADSYSDWYARANNLSISSRSLVSEQNASISSSSKSLSSIFNKVRLLLPRSCPYGILLSTEAHNSIAEVIESVVAPSLRLGRYSPGPSGS